MQIKYDFAGGKFEKQRKILRDSGKKYGASNGKIMCKFTTQEAESIRKKYQMGLKQTEIAKEYKVDQSTISLIVNKKTYA